MIILNFQKLLIKTLHAIVMLNKTCEAFKKTMTTST